jgi:hypothetical protein
MNQSKSNTLTNQVQNAMSKTKNIGAKVMNTTTKIKNTISSGITNKVNKITNSTSSSQWFQGMSTFINNFSESNTAFSKFVFIILILILTIFLFQIGMVIMTSFIHGFSGDVYVIKGMTNANKEKIVSSNPNIKDSVAILKSVNENDGLEFTWSVWFYVNNLNSIEPTRYNKIFSKGTGVDSENNTLSLDLNSKTVYTQIINNSPGMYLTSYIADDDSTGIAPNINFTQDLSGVSLVIALNTYTPGDKEFAELITIKNIFLDKWVNCTLIVKNRTANVYINGVFNKQKILNNIPVQNNYDTYIGDSNFGFDGYISNLKYSNRAISYEEVRSIYSNGPNLTSVDNMTPSGVDYASLSWYYNLNI